LSQREPRVIEKDLTCSCERNTVRATRQQLNADLIFEIPDLATKRRLCRMEPSFSRDCEAALFGDGDEIAKVP
jgi:hypothetical protein